MIGRKTAKKKKQTHAIPIPIGGIILTTIAVLVINRVPKKLLAY